MLNKLQFKIRKNIKLHMLFFIAINILFLLKLIHSYANIPSVKESVSDVELSFDELKIILNNVVIADLGYWGTIYDKKITSFNKLAFYSTSTVSNGRKYCLTIESHNTWNPLVYIISSENSIINNSTLKLFYIHSPPRQLRPYVWCFAIDKNKNIYRLHSFDKCDFDELINCLFPSDLSEKGFYELCFLYINNVYRPDTKTIILGKLEDLPFYKSQELSNSYFIKHNEKWKNIVIENLKKELYPPAMEYFNGNYHLSLFTYSCFNGEIIEWDFYIGSKKHFEVTKRTFFQDAF